MDRVHGWQSTLGTPFGPVSSCEKSPGWSGSLQERLVRVNTQDVDRDIQAERCREREKLRQLLSKDERRRGDCLIRFVYGKPIALAEQQHEPKRRYSIVTRSARYRI